MNFRNVIRAGITDEAEKRPIARPEVMELLALELTTATSASLDWARGFVAFAFEIDDLRIDLNDKLTNGKREELSVKPIFGGAEMLKVDMKDSEKAKKRLLGALHPDKMKESATEAITKALRANQRVTVQTCQACLGKGQLLEPGDLHRSEGWVPCTRCAGTGQVGI